MKKTHSKDTQQPTLLLHTPGTGQLVKVYLLFLLIIAGMLSGITSSFAQTCPSWGNVGAALFSPGNTDFSDITISSSGTPYVAFRDNANSAKATVMKFDGTNWVLVGSAGFSAGAVQYTHIALDGSGTPYVTYVDLANGFKANVMKFDGTNWVAIGGSGISVGAINYTSIAINSSGVPYVVYNDHGVGIKTVVKKYDGTNWIVVGTEGFSPGTADAPDIAIDASGTPTVLFEDGSTGLATAMKFNGTDWVLIGSAGFSAGIADGPYLAVDASGTPYASYRDGGNSNKLTVMKFDGTNWVNVGTPGFSVGAVQYTDIAVDGSGTPYVTFGDGGLGLEPRVMKYNGSTWVDVAGSVIFSGLAQYNAIAINSSGTPYVVYKDFFAGGAATVTKLNQVSIAVSGVDIMCETGAVSYMDAASGGIWSSSNTAIATIGSSDGTVNGISGGVVSITYTLGSCVASKSLTVLPLPSSGIITGTATVCTGATTTLGNTISGGTWSSNATGIATIGSSTGIVTGIAAGNATISYSVTNSCGSGVVTTVVTVNALPDPGTIAGVDIMCETGAVTMTTTGTGGVWSSSNPAIGSIDASGNVYGLSSGTITISYTVTNACGSASATHVTTVLPLPGAGGITGTLTVCVAATTTLGNAVSGGVWSSASTGIATIDGSGIVTGVAAGNATISYTVTNSCGTAISTTTVTVNPLPSAGAITGASSVDVGASITLADATSGGIWSSGSTSIATVNSAGVVTGVTDGSVAISYSVTNSCGTDVATHMVTVNALFPITGQLSICMGTTGTLATASAPGIGWTSSNTSIATIDSSSGVVTAVSPGTATITFTKSAGAYVTAEVTINPFAGAISGNITVCTGSTTSLSSVEGGTWTSGNTAKATVDVATGVVTGVSVGTAIITNTIPTGCLAMATVTINATPAIISGPMAICVGATTTLTDATTSGTWSSGTTSVATIGTAGTVAAVAPGISAISYTGTNGCIRTAMLTVSATPSITGPSLICIGNTVALSPSTTGGTWVASTAGVASIGFTTGTITGSATGTTNITYTLNSFCKTSITITVGVGPAAITGGAAVCNSATTTLSDATPGGTWSSANTAIASIDATTGVVTGASAGTTYITYGFGAGCYKVKSITIGGGLGSLTGATALCVGATSIYTSTMPIVGTGWTSSNTSVATVGSISGVVTGIAPGVATITFTPYAFSSYAGCVGTRTVTVDAVPSVAPITGPTSVRIGHTITLADATPGGIWTSNLPAKASVSPTGVVTGIAVPAATISYNVTNGACVYPLTRLITVTAGREAPLPDDVDEVFSLYPNPTAGSITLKCPIAGAFTVYTLEGKELLNTNLTEGSNTINLPKGMAAGIYMCRFTGKDNTVQTVRLIYEP